jgi:hypothetical protein
MLFTTQLAAQTPNPMEAMTVENSTNVATHAFTFGPPCFVLKFASYMDLPAKPQQLPFPIYPR